MSGAHASMPSHGSVLELGSSSFLRRVDIIIPLSVSRSDIKDIIEDIIFIYVYNILVYFIHPFGINKSPFMFYVYF